MRDRARTDREVSISADEFIWSQPGHTGAHKYLIDPVLAHLRRHEPRRVLDLGCGNGSVSARLAAQGYDVVGCDASASGLRLAEVHAPQCKFFQHDFQLALPAQHRAHYDAVVSLEVIEHLLLPRKLMQAAFDALKPGGLLVLSTPYHGYLKNLALALTNQFDKHWHPLRDYGHIKFFSKSTILTLFAETGFQDMQFATAGRIPPLACSMIVAGRMPLA